MGSHANISATKFPKQGRYLNKRTRVCFNYDTSQTLWGTIVRNDAEEPFRTLIHLDNGHFLDAVECQYSPE